MMQAVCRKCNQTFGSKSQLTYHHKVTHQNKCRVTCMPRSSRVPGVTLTLTRNAETGMFHCPGRTCSMQYSKPALVRDHAKKCTLLANTSVLNQNASSAAAAPENSEDAHRAEMEAAFSTPTDPPDPTLNRLTTPRYNHRCACDINSYYQQMIFYAVI